MATAAVEAAVEGVEAAAFTVPTERPEADGTLSWDATTMVVAEAFAGPTRGVGYTYGPAATAKLVDELLADAVRGRDAMDVPAAWDAMVAAVRNAGRPGIASMAIAAVDVALWDLKARLIGLALVELLGARRESIPVYGSGGFTSYDPGTLRDQLTGWVAGGIPRVKMKVGSRPDEDPARVMAARAAIGPEAGLMVDANGAHDRTGALAAAEAFEDADVSWFEEPVSSDDLEGLRMIRDRGPGGMEVAAGEYGYDLPYFRRMLEAGAVDVLQADATRCAGFTELLRVDALCRDRSVPLSAHTAPTLHGHIGCVATGMRDAEYFHDHARVEGMLLDGALAAEDGELRPDRSRPGLGIELKRPDAERFEG
jgi:L-alanine-DL-glutamate epimerase-like enolase superfamily enzyme